LAHEEQVQLLPLPSPWPLALEEHEAQVHELQSQLLPLAQEVHEL